MKKLKQSKYDSIIILYNKIIIFSLFFLSFFTKQPFPYRWHRWCVNLYHLQQHKHSQEHEHESQRGECDANLDGGCVRLCWKMTLGVHIGRRRWWHSDSRFGFGCSRMTAWWHATEAWRGTMEASQCMAVLDDDGVAWEIILRGRGAYWCYQLSGQKRNSACVDNDNSKFDSGNSSPFC